MKRIGTIALAVAAVALAAALGFADTWQESERSGEEVFSKTYPFRDGARLNVDVSDVHIDVRHGDDGQATVKVYLQARDEEEGHEYYDRLNFRVEQRDDKLNVTTRRSRWSGFNWRSYDRVRVWTVITVPRGVDMRLKTDDGDIRGGALEGDLIARSSDGDIRMDSAKGTEITLRTSDGDVDVGEIIADRVQVASSDGDVRSGHVEGQFVSFSSSDGDVVVDEVEADELHMTSSDGDLRVTMSGKRLRARTSDGNIRVTLTGALDAELKSSDGDITIDLPGDIAVDVDLRGEHIRLDGDVRGEISRRRVVGKLGGGGPEIVARSNDGRISLATR